MTACGKLRYPDKRAAVAPDEISRRFFLPSTLARVEIAP